MRWSRRVLIALAAPLSLALGLFGSCDNPTVTTMGGDAGVDTPGIRGLVSINVTPADLQLSGGDQAKTQGYSASGVFSDGHTEDVTNRVTWSVVPPALGRFQGPALTTAGYGGEGTVYARSGTLTGSATLRVRVSRVVRDPSAPAGAGPGSFGGAIDPAAAPQVVYPYDRVLFPPNLTSLEVHFTRGAAANTLFELTFQNKVTDLTVYTACTPPAPGDPSGCIYAVPGSLWDILARSNQGNGQPGDPVLLTVRGTNGAKVGVSASLAMQVSPDDLRGGIYYWTAEGGTSGIYRVDLEKQVREPFFLVSDGPADHRGDKTCVGCHALSHAGDRMTLVLGGGHISDLLMLSVQKPKPPLYARIDTTPGKTQAERQFSNYQTFGPDGSSLVSALRGTLSLLSATDGTPLIGAINTGGKATQPDWSRSGSLLAFTRYSDVTPAPPANDGDNAEFFIKKGAIGLLRWDGKTFTDLKTLVPEKANQNSYYPTVAPGEQFVVFNRAAGCVAGDDCSAYHNPRAKLYLIATQNGSEQELTNINRGGPNDLDGAGKVKDTLTNSWPKFSPFKQTYGTGGRTLLWVTFSSTRNYGLRLRQGASADPRPQLWMAAIAVGGEPVGGDPSFRPFWLPAQNLSTNNHIAQWTEQVVPILQ